MNCFMRKACLLPLLACWMFVLPACAIPSLSTTIPTPTLSKEIVSSSTPVPTDGLPKKVISSLESNVLGQWKVVNGGAWEGATITFYEDGNLTLSGGSPVKDDKGSYYFTAEDVIVFNFQDYQGSADIELITNKDMSLVVTRSDEAFNAIYSLERVE